MCIKLSRISSSNSKQSRRKEFTCLNFSSNQTSKVIQRLTVFSLILYGRYNFKIQIMINSTIFVFLVLFAGALSNNIGQKDDNEIDKRRDVVTNKLWASESIGNNVGVAALINPTFVYEVKNNTLLSNETISRMFNVGEKGLAKEEQEGDEQDNYTSASILKPTLKSSSKGMTKTSTDNRLDQPENNYQIKSDHSNNSNNSSNKVKKSTKLKYFVNPTKKVSLASFLPKSKRQDSSKSSLPSVDNKMHPGRHLSSLSFDPFLSTSVPSQPIITYPTGSSLLFGPSTAQIALPTFFNFPPRAHPLPILNTLNQHHQIHQPQIPHHSLNPFEVRNAAQLIEQLQKQVRLDNAKQRETPFMFASSDTSNIQQPQQPQQQQQQPQQLLKKDELKGNQDVMKLSSIQNSDISSQQSSTQTISSPNSAVALLSERAKNLLSQMSLSNQLASFDGGGKDNHNHQLIAANIIRNNRDTSGTSIKPSPTNNIGLSSMIKNAAEAWAANNAGTDSTPTIIVEHDGPTITSLDFNPNGTPQPIQPQVVDGNIQAEPPDEDDVTAFYSEENEETEGSNNAKRIAKFKQHQHPFIQQSNVVQTDTPFADDFFDTNNNGEFGGKRVVGVENGQINGNNINNGNQNNHNNNINNHNNEIRDSNNDITQNYARYNKFLDQTLGAYPDSINAIKEQSGKGGELVSLVSNKISTSNKDQIEQLIKELQNLNKRKRKNDPNLESDSETDSESRRGKNSLNDDYEDYYNKNSNRNNNADDLEDDQTKLIRKKLLSRLKGKRRGRVEDSDSSDSYISNHAIKIPLHALLLAALDRRMSSSSEQTRTVDSSADGRNKNNSGYYYKQLQQQDHAHQGSSSLSQRNNSPTMNTNNFGSSVKAKTSPKLRILDNTGPTKPFNNTGVASNNLSLLRNQDPSVLYLLNNFGFPSMFDSLRGNSSTILGIDSNRAKSENESNSNNSNDNNNGSNQSQPPASTTTTALVGTNSHKALPGRDLAGQQEQPNDTKGTRTQESSRKGRRDLGIDEASDGGSRGADNEGDFDVDKQINEYSGDKNDNPLEPSWARPRGGIKDRERDKKTSVDFDDDFEDLASKSAASNNRKRVLKRRRLPPNESTYEQGEDKFLNNLDKDTADSGNEIDKSTSGIDDPIVPENEDQRVKQKPFNREEDDSRDEDEKDGHSDEENDGENNERRQQQQRNGHNNGSGAESRTNEVVTWKPDMIDDEVAKIEILAKRRRNERERGRQQRKFELGKGNNRLGNHDDTSLSDYDHENHDKATDSDDTSALPQRYDDTSESQSRRIITQPDDEATKQVKQTNQ